MNNQQNNANDAQAPGTKNVYTGETVPPLEHEEYARQFEARLAEAEKAKVDKRRTAQSRPEEKKPDPKK